MKVTILGSGAYGLALGVVLNKNKHDVTLWTPFVKEAKTLSEAKERPVLKGTKLPDNLKYTTNLEIVKSAD